MLGSRQSQDGLSLVLGSQETNQDIGFSVLCSGNLNIEFLKLFWRPDVIAESGKCAMNMKRTLSVSQSSLSLLFLSSDRRKGGEGGVAR